MALGDTHSAPGSAQVRGRLITVHSAVTTLLGGRGGWGRYHYCVLQKRKQGGTGFKGLPRAGELGLSLSVWPLHHRLMNSFH